MSFINTYTFFLNSAYRQSGTNAWPSWFLDRQLTLEDPNNSFFAKVLSAEIPASYSGITDSYNSIPYTFTVPESSISVTSTMLIPVGNYTILTLLTQLQTLMVGVMTTSGFSTVKQPTLNFTYDTTTSKVTLGYSAAPVGYTFTFRLKWGLADLIARFFGFVATGPDSVISYTSAGVDTSTGILSSISVNVNPITSITLRSDLLSQTSDNMERYIEQGWSSSNILAKTFVTSGANTFLFFNDTNYTVKLQNKTVDAIDIYVAGLTFDPLYLNGISWNCVIQIMEFEPRMVQFNREQMLIREYDNRVKIEDLRLQREELRAKLETKVNKIRGSIKQQDASNIQQDSATIPQDSEGLASRGVQ